MARGHVTEETMRLIFTAETSKLRQEVVKTEKTVEELRQKEVELRKEQAAVKTVFGESSKEYKDVTARLKQNTQAVADETEKLKLMRKQIGTDAMTMAELRKEARQLQYQLDNTSKALNPEQYKILDDRLREVTGRMKELKESASDTSEASRGFFKNLLGAKTNFSQLKTILTASGIGAVASMAFDTVTDYATRAYNRVKDLVTESVAAARAAEGITHAFEQMDKPGLLQNLRRATHGTVADLELMKAAVQANDFRLPLDQLGKYLEFAQLKAQQTGQSVDYMTNSIVTGLGRKSLQILDNLGISASEVKEEMEKTGDMATAVGNIIDRQLADAGEHFETAAEREERATTGVSNAQLKLGQQMQRTFGIGSTSFSEMQAKAETFVLNGLTKLIIYLQNLYDRMTTVRIVVEAVKVAFDTLFKVCEAGFYALLDTVRIVGRTLMDAGALIESLFTAIVNHDFSPIENSWKMLTSNLERGFSRMGRHLMGTGTRWGQNFIDSINAVTGKATVTPPAVPRLPAVPHGASAPAGSASGAAAAGASAPAGSAGGSSPSSADPYRQQLAAREQAYREYGNSLRQMLLHQYITEEEYRQESLEAELKFLSDKAALQQQYGEDVTETQRQYLDRMLQEATRRHQQEQEQLKKRQEQERRDLERNRLSQEGNNEYLQKVEWQGQTFDRMRQLNEEYLQQNLISYQQYQDNLTRIAQEQEAQRQQLQQAAIDATQQLLSSASSFFSAMQQRETAQVDAKYKRLIDAAKKQGKDTTKLEEQQQTEKAAIAKKYADRNFKIQVLQIIANTAQGISKTIAELGMPWAVPFVAMAAAAGAMQLAAAKASAEQAAGLYSGGYTASAGSASGVEGYTRRGDPRRQAGFIPVHQNEFVANHLAVANPHLRPVLDVIDRHQHLGDIQMLNATRLLDEAYGQGRYQGGYTRSATSSAPGGSAAVSDASPSETADRLLPILTRIEQNTARSLTVRRLRDEIAHEERLEQNARR